jgi:hypothetical protein
MKHLNKFYNYLNEYKLEIYPIQIPPSKEDSIELVIKNGGDIWVIYDVETSDIDLIRNTFLEGSEVGVRHEAVHILQQLNIPEIFNNAKPLTIEYKYFKEIYDNDFSIKGIKHEKDFYNYFSLEHEIMAYAFSYTLIKNNPNSITNANGKLDKDTIYEKYSNRIYKSIGGDIYLKFKKYCKEYQKEYQK